MLNILVVDDSEMARKRVIKSIDKAGVKHTIIGEEEDGVQALAVFRELNPNLLITDLEMPNMNGLELIQNIRNISESVHIIVISSLINEQVRQTLRHDKYLDFVKKPMEEKIIKTLLLKIKHQVLIEGES